TLRKAPPRKALRKNAMTIVRCQNAPASNMNFRRECRATERGNQCGTIGLATCLNTGKANIGDECS
ncbi:hypothetical protein NZA98_18685, partial [Escherichia coli]|nr:hypothetical protein [Escherichia coli]